MNEQRYLWIKAVAERISADFLIVSSVSTFIACQWALESQYGKSNIAKNNNNFGGMKLATIRPTTALSVDREHAKYDKPLDFYVDYFLWLSWNHFTQSELCNLDKFKHHLKTSGYCPGSQYLDRIGAIYSDFMSHRKSINNVNSSTTEPS